MYDLNSLSQISGIISTAIAAILFVFYFVDRGNKPATCCPPKKQKQSTKGTQIALSTRKTSEINISFQVCWVDIYVRIKKNLLAISPCYLFPKI